MAVRKTLIQITTHDDLQEYYSESNKVLTEQVIIRKNGAILKPDRMVIDTNGNILLLDYKTGVHNSKYFNQLEQYSDAIQEIGYNVAKKALVYIASEVNVVDLNS
ncbi:MAG: hypothetical protein ITG00_01885 [Flavobacterium sp.]|nr:hypothetical protein [Flavobacterium sp.]